MPCPVYRDDVVPILTSWLCLNFQYLNCVHLNAMYITSNGLKTKVVNYYVKPYFGFNIVMVFNTPCELIKSKMLSVSRTREKYYKFV